MTTGAVTEPRVAKKKGKAKEEPSTPDQGPGFGRIELQAPPEWIEQLDAAAAAIGLSRSAYIRFACNRQMAADRRSQQEGQP